MFYAQVRLFKQNARPILIREEILSDFNIGEIPEVLGSFDYAYYRQEQVTRSSSSKKSKSGASITRFPRLLLFLVSVPSFTQKFLKDKDTVLKFRTTHFTRTYDLFVRLFS